MQNNTPSILMRAGYTIKTQPIFGCVEQAFAVVLGPRSRNMTAHSANEFLLDVYRLMSQWVMIPDVPISERQRVDELLEIEDFSRNSLEALSVDDIDSAPIRMRPAVLDILQDIPISRRKDVYHTSVRAYWIYKNRYISSRFDTLWVLHSIAQYEILVNSNIAPMLNLLAVETQLQQIRTLMSMARLDDRDCKVYETLIHLGSHWDSAKMSALLDTPEVSGSPMLAGFLSALLSIEPYLLEPTMIVLRSFFWGATTKEIKEQVDKTITNAILCAERTDFEALTKLDFKS